MELQRKHFFLYCCDNIGYGSFAPVTAVEQLLTIIYGMINIPVTGTILITTANTVLKLITYLYTLSIDKIDKAFDALDKDGGGFLDRKEMRQCLEELIAAKKSLQILWK